MGKNENNKNIMLNINSIIWRLFSAFSPRNFINFSRENHEHQSARDLNGSYSNFSLLVIILRGLFKFHKCLV